jgi:hypothetical protein
LSKRSGIALLTPVADDRERDDAREDEGEVVGGADDPRVDRASHAEPEEEEPDRGLDEREDEAQTLAPEHDEPATREGEDLLHPFGHLLR